MGRTVKHTEKEISAADQAYSGIIDLVLHHELRPGERTSVNLLAARLKLGRTPVKEAITRLQTEGVLSVTGQSGTMVNKIDHSQTEHLFALRKALEDFAADGAVKNVTVEQLARMREFLQEMRAQTAAQPDIRSAAGFVRANVAFHALIVAATGNVFLVRLYSQLQMQLQIVTYLMHRGYDRRAAALRQREHEAIYKAMAARNGRLLKSLLRNHAQNTETAILAMLKESYAVSAATEGQRRRPLGGTNRRDAKIEMLV
jgi:DNA-binding GntR family transcriptional regulator